MIKRLKDNMSLTLVEVLVAMLILSSSTAGVLGSFSYSFKFIRRAGHKIEAMNYGRKAQEVFRAMRLHSSIDTRLNPQPAWTNVSENPPNLGFLYNAFHDGTAYQPYGGGIIQYKITTGTAGSSQVSVRVVWDNL